MKRILFALLVLVAAPLAAQSLPQGSPAALGMDAARLHRIDSVMQSLVDQGKIPGAVTMILRQGRVVQQGAYGFADKEAGRRMTTGTLFRIASQTKAITSTAAMILVEQGRLRLSDPVWKFVPSFRHTTVMMKADSGMSRVAASRSITIRDLLTHSAGISYGTDPQVADLYRAQGLGPAAGWGWYFADKTEPICASIDRLGTLPFVAQPGSRFVYGYNTDILGCIVERVSGRPLDQFITDNILRPLRMTHTFFYVPQDQRDLLAAVYAGTDSGGYVRAPDGPMGQGNYVDGPRTSFSGGAGLISTAGDYARFLQMMENGGVLDGARILSPATVALMTSGQLGDVYGQSGKDFGLGFEILTNPGLAASYGGAGSFSWGGAYGSGYWADPQYGLVGVFMIQMLPGTDANPYSRLRDIVYGAITGPARAAATASPAGRSR